MVNKISKVDDKIRAVKDIKAAAKIYKQELVGKTFLYVFNGNYIEVIFKKANFKHLTGVDTTLSANEFYKMAINGKLQHTQIFFTERHPFKLAKRKLRHIHNIATLATSKSIMLKEIVTEKRTFKFGSTDLEFSICFNKENENEVDESPYYIAQSIRDEDCFSRSSDACFITHIFSRPNDQKIYNKLLYIDSKASIQELSPDIRQKLSDEIIYSDTDLKNMELIGV